MNSRASRKGSLLMEWMLAGALMSIFYVGFTELVRQQRMLAALSVEKLELSSLAETVARRIMKDPGTWLVKRDGRVELARSLPDFVVPANVTVTLADQLLAGTLHRVIVVVTRARGARGAGIARMEVMVRV